MTVALPSYIEMAEAPGLRLFRCAPLRSTLSTRACAKNHVAARDVRPDEVSCIRACAACELGAHHAGVPLVRLSKLHGLDLCPRCHQYAGRIISGTRCVSCYNREAEQVKGRNGKGTAPTMAPLLPRRLAVVIDGRATEVRSERTATASEIALAVLRLVPGRIQFARPRGRPAVDLAEFVAPHRPGAQRPPSGAAAKARKAA